MPATIGAEIILSTGKKMPVIGAEIILSTGKKMPVIGLGYGTVSCYSVLSL